MDSIVLEELEALSSIYLDLVKVDATARRIIYAEDGSKLIVDLPTDYPDKVPVFTTEHAEVRRLLLETSNKLIGSEMLFELIELFRELVKKIKETQGREGEKKEVAIELRAIAAGTPFSVERFKEWQQVRYRSILLRTKSAPKDSGKEYFQKMKQSGITVEAEEE